MSVLVKGMDMPKDFFRCPFAHVGQTLSKTLCRVDAKNPKYCCGVGNDGCPLIEIPKHGDLIDRDALLESDADVREDYVCDGYVEDSTLGYSWEKIQNAPTVIE